MTAGTAKVAAFFALWALVSVPFARGAETPANWPQWRGPLASGFAPDGDPPTTWAEGKNVRWKVKLPGQGTSTPIVWGDSIFIQTAIPSGQKAGAAAPTDKTQAYQFVLMCLDRSNGQTKWQKIAREVVPHEGHHKDHGYASYSPVTDGQHVYAYFGSRGLHCFDMQGNLKWEKDLGKMQTRMEFGEGSSPALYGDTIVVTWDHMGPDFIVAFDKTTGEERWRTPRDEDQTWSTPLIVEHGGAAQVITAATKKVRSYDLKSGKQIWEAPGLTPNTIPSPVSADGVVYVISGFRGTALYAVRLGGSGDLTGTDSIIWKGGKGTPYVPSPLLYGDRLYFYSGNNGILSCVDAKTGKSVLETQRIDDLEGVYASPVAAAGRVYLVGRSGATVVIKHLDQTNKLEVLATNKLDDHFDASPAVAGKELFLRGRESLYCIGE